MQLLYGCIHTGLAMRLNELKAQLRLNEQWEGGGERREEEIEGREGGRERGEGRSEREGRKEKGRKER